MIKTPRSGVQSDPFEASPNDPDKSYHDSEVFAWLQCAGAFFLFFNSWGLVNTFGNSVPIRT